MQLYWHMSNRTISLWKGEVSRTFNSDDPRYFLARYLLENDEPALSFFLDAGYRFTIPSPNGYDIIVESCENPREYNCYVMGFNISTIDNMCSQIVNLIYREFKFGESAYAPLWAILQKYMKEKVRIDIFPHIDGIVYDGDDVIITGKYTKYNVNLKDAFITLLLPQGGSETLCIHARNYVKIPGLTQKEENLLTKIIWCLNDEAFYEYTGMFKWKIDRLRKKGWLFSQKDDKETEQ